MARRLVPRGGILHEIESHYPLTSSCFNKRLTNPSPFILTRSTCLVPVVSRVMSFSGVARAAVVML